MSLPGLSQLPLSLSLSVVGWSPLVQVAELVRVAAPVQVAELEMFVGPGPVTVRPAFQALVPLATFVLGFLKNLCKTITLLTFYFGTANISCVPGADGLKRGAPDGHVGDVPGDLSPVGLGPETLRAGSKQLKNCPPGTVGLNS